MFSLKNLARKGLTSWVTKDYAKDYCVSAWQVCILQQIVTQINTTGGYNLDFTKIFKKHSTDHNTWRHAFKYIMNNYKFITVKQIIISEIKCEVKFKFLR